MLPSERVAASVLLGIGDTCSNESTGNQPSAKPPATNGTKAAAASEKKPGKKFSSQEAKAYIAEHVEHPGEHDVLCGRGGKKVGNR